jgi:osmotically-inducible protein OsmY
MSIATLSDIDLRIRDAVMAQLEWDADVDAAEIAVAARDGIVTLTGVTGTYASKLAAERAARRVRGVRGVANDVQVRLRLERTDAEIAADAVKALQFRATVPESVQVVVHNGHLTLTGTVATLFQRTVAAKAVRYIRGLKGISNHITVVVPATATDVRRGIARALHRDAAIDSRGIKVTVNDNKVTLTGQVRTWQERESAERAATYARGITEVDNQLTVAWPYEPHRDEEL